MITGYGDYEQGDTGSGVWTLQSNLTNLGFDTGGIDGAFGKQTYAALRNFQAAAGLDPTGIADERTLIALSQALAKRGIAPTDPQNPNAGTNKKPLAATPAAYPFGPPPPPVVQKAGLSPTMQKVALAAAGVAVLGLMSSRR